MKQIQKIDLSLRGHNVAKANYTIKTKGFLKGKNFILNEKATVLKW